MSNSISINEILKLLPYRFPFLLIDKVIDFKENKFLQAIKNITYNDSLSYNHFPNNPIFPGVLIIEAIAQASNILIVKSLHKKSKKKQYYLAAINHAYFKHPVYPGDQLHIEIKITKKKNFFNIDGVAKVNKKIVCKTSILCTKNLKKK